MQEVFEFPNQGFAFAVAEMHKERGTPCKLYKLHSVWYVAI